MANSPRPGEVTGSTQGAATPNSRPKINGNAIQERPTRRMSRRFSTFSASSMHSDDSGTHVFEQQNLFVDPEAMKKKVRENLMKPTYDVSQYYHSAGLFRSIATNSAFEKITLGVIAFNAVWIGIDTDHNKAETLLKAQPIFQISEHLFCFFFSFEWFVRFMSFRKKYDCLKDAWMIFDSILVSTMVTETWVVTLIVLSSASQGGGGMGNASILRMARLLRLSRMARMARLLRKMPELMILIKGIGAAARSVFFTLALLCLLMYLFAIFFSQLTVGTPVGKEYFNKVGAAMYTLLVYGTLMDNIAQPLNKLGQENIFFGACFLLFVLLAALTLMNMLIGVLTEVVSAVAATEKETLTVTFVKMKMQEVLKKIDQDGDGTISKNEFVKILENKTATEALHEVDVDVVGLVDFADFIFADEDGTGNEEKSLTFANFMEVVLQFRGCNNATVKDIVNLRKFVSNSLKKQREELHELRDLIDAKTNMRLTSLIGSSVGFNEKPRSSESKLREGAEIKREEKQVDYIPNPVMKTPEIKASPKQQQTPSTASSSQPHSSSPNTVESNCCLAVALEIPPPPPSDPPLLPELMPFGVGKPIEEIEQQLERAATMRFPCQELEGSDEEKSRLPDLIMSHEHPARSGRVEPDLPIKWFQSPSPQSPSADRDAMVLNLCVQDEQLPPMPVFGPRSRKIYHGNEHACSDFPI